jgi:uncharacterized protein YjiS (DUF1127 family)
MKPTGNTMQASIFAPAHKFSLATITAVPMQLLSTLGRGISKGLTQIQINRMQSVLNSMTDAQLAQVGIDRSQIRSHAEYLITYKYDGL